MKYMLLIYLEENSLSEAERSHCYQESAAYARQLHERKQYLATAPLYPTSTATSVRIRDGKRLITDGPFAETREQLGGFFLIEAENLDKAIEIAGEIPAGRWGTVEIRPVIEVEGLPAGSMEDPHDSKSKQRRGSLCNRHLNRPKGQTKCGGQGASSRV